MIHGRRTTLRRFTLEAMEERIVLSSAANGFVPLVTRGAPVMFTAVLTPAGVKVPVDKTKGTPIAAVPDPTDPARGRIVLTASHNAQELWVVGNLSHISNVSAVTLHDLKYPGNPPNYPGIIGDTVAVLLVPGSGSGPRTTASFRTVIKAPYLTGPLVGHPLSALVRDLKAGAIYANVQTNNSVDPSPAPAGPGNFPFGEIRGPMLPG